MNFGFVYTAQGLIVYDVCREDDGDEVVYVAALSSDPRVHFQAPTPERALARLLAHLGVQPRTPAA